tara:strand:- start:986 stop:1375 length:390 start_codon:yes stop_codon:yes gene_type:complete
MKKNFGISVLREALKSRGYTIQEHPEDFLLDIAAERNGFIEFFLVAENKDLVWNNREDYEEETVSFNSLTQEVREESFWYAIVCTETKAFIIAHSSEIFQEKYLDGEVYTIPNNKCFIINYKEFSDVSS